MTRITRESLNDASAATSPTLLDAIPSFRRSLQAQNKADKTVTAYVEAVHRLNEYLSAQGMPTRLAAITREHLEAFQVDQLSRLSAASAKTRHASPRQFFRWAVEEAGELTVSPMDKLQPPAVPEQPVPVLSEDHLRAMLRFENSSDYLDRRDAAILRLLIDTGARLSEVANLNVEDVNFDMGTVTFMGKGGRTRHNPVGPKTLRAIDRYLKVRERHSDRADPALWLGTQGKMSSVGVAEAMKRRARDAGVEDFHTHQLRHTAAHRLRLAGVDDDSVLRLMGWRDRSMLHRYGASAADERAHAAHRRAGLGDRV